MLDVMGIDAEPNVWPDRGAVIMEWLQVGFQYLLGYHNSPLLGIMTPMLIIE